MLISNSHNFLFIHIFKTAGTSVRDVFLPYSRLIERLTFEFYLSKKLVGLYARLRKLENDGQAFMTGFHKHATAAEVREKMGAQQFDRYFTFCFVRNPYDHMVSLYHYIKQSRGHYLHQEAVNRTFEDFLAYYIAQKPQRQSDFVFDVEGNALVKFIGRFEHLEEDTQTLCKQLGLPAPKMSKKNTSNRAKKWGTYFQDESTKKLFQDYFQADFAHFNYPM